MELIYLSENIYDSDDECILGESSQNDCPSWKTLGKQCMQTNGIITLFYIS